MKVHQDNYHTNKHMALVGGISNAEMNKLELEFLKVMGFQFLLLDFETFCFYSRTLSEYHLYYCGNSK